MESIKIIKDGFKYLEDDCRRVALLGFVDANSIPTKAIKTEIDDEDFKHKFSHSYDDLASHGWDDADFYGDIYLPLKDDEYLKFEVGA